jgi:hypothetical protein
MTAIRFEIVNEHGGVEVPDGMMSSPEHVPAVDDARHILEGAPSGWRVHLWKDVDLVRPLSALGEPHAVWVIR